MNKYEIYNYEISETAIVEAEGVFEAMFKYLPWDNAEFKIIKLDKDDYCEVEDLQTDFSYRVKKIK